MSCNDCNDVTLLAGNDGVGIQTIVDNGDGTFTLFLTDGSTFTTPNFAATVAAGTTTTLAPGSPATVTNSGTTQNAIFDFGIPEGIQGPVGPQGDFNLTPRTVDNAFFPKTLALADEDKILLCDNATANVINIPEESSVAFDDGTVIFLRQNNASAPFTVTPLGAVTLQSLGGVTQSRGQYATAMLVKTGTDFWNLSWFDYPGATNGLFSQTADGPTVQNTTTETSIVGTGVGTLSVPANGFQVGDSFHAKIGGRFSTQNGHGITINVKTGATVLATTTILGSLQSAVSQGFEIELDFTIRAIGAAGEICTNGDFVYTNLNDVRVFNDTVVFDTTVTNTLDVTIQWDQTSVSDAITATNFVLYKNF